MAEKISNNTAGLIKTVGVTVGIVLVLTGVVGSYFVNDYRLGQVEEKVKELEDIKGAIIEMKADIKYIKEKLG
jgi:hypothetical protein